MKKITLALLAFSLLLTSCVSIIPEGRGQRVPSPTVVKVLTPEGRLEDRRYAKITPQPKRVELPLVPMTVRADVVQRVEYEIRGEMMSAYSVTTTPTTETKKRLSSGKIVWLVTDEDSDIFDSYGSFRFHCFKVHAYWIVENYHNSGVTAISPSGHSESRMCGPTFG
jgi:hypothetical protein